MVDIIMDVHQGFLNFLIKNLQSTEEQELILKTSKQQINYTNQSLKNLKIIKVLFF